MVRKFSLVAAGLALAVLSACQPPAQLLVEKAYIQLSPVKDNPSALYFTVRGGPADTELRSVTSAYIQRLEMHETVEEDGMSMMKPITSVPVPTRSEVKFEPGGRHVMVWGLDNAALTAGKAEFEFSFSNGDRILADAVINTIKPAGGAAQ